MNERPILFNTEMVKAILGDRKTQTRRVIKHYHHGYPKGLRFEEINNHGEAIFIDDNTGEIRPHRCPFGQPGDLLWVRETFKPVSALFGSTIENTIEYKADGERIDYSPGYVKYSINDISSGKWKPSIFLPKWAARIWLKVKSVRVERIQNIDYDDILEEGLNHFYVEAQDSGWWDVPAVWVNSEGRLIKRITTDDRILAFKEYWNYINKKRGFSWESNPWVWVGEFERVER